MVSMTKIMNQLNTVHQDKLVTERYMYCWPVRTNRRYYCIHIVLSDWRKTLGEDEGRMGK